MQLVCCVCSVRSPEIPKILKYSAWNGRSFSLFEEGKTLWHHDNTDQEKHLLENDRKGICNSRARKYNLKEYVPL